MAVRPILTWPDDRLVRRCAAVPAVDAGIKALSYDLFDTLYDSGGRGLAAPQIGDMRRVCVMDAGWKTGTPEPVLFINPLIRFSGGGVTRSSEQCLSIPGVTAQVSRHRRIALSWTGLDAEVKSAEFEGFEAICIQHELDHLDGIVTLMHVSPDQRAQLEAEYFS